MAKRIMIVEDDYDVLCILTDLLNGEGYEVAALNHTNSIVDSVTQHRPDLVMLDFLLPGVNGGELCHELKMNTQTAELPVILLSGYPRLVESLGNYGSDAFIAKPFDIEGVLHLVESCLNHKTVLA